MLLPMQCSKSYFNLTSSQCFTDFRPASDIPHIYEQHLHVNQVLSPLLENRLLQKPPPPHSRHSSPHFRHIRAIFYSVNIFISYLTVRRYSCNILRRENWQNILLRTFLFGTNTGVFHPLLFDSSCLYPLFCLMVSSICSILFRLTSVLPASSFSR